jgi:hypothetical protein
MPDEWHGHTSANGGGTNDSVLPDLADFPGRRVTAAIGITRRRLRPNQAALRVGLRGLRELARIRSAELIEARGYHRAFG